MKNMKKLLTVTLSVLMLALPVMSLAEAVVVDELGMTLEVPVGYTAEYTWDDGLGMLGMTILPTEEGPVAFSVFAQYSAELEGVSLATMSDDQKAALQSSIASVVEDPKYDVYTDDASGMTFVSVSNGAGNLVMVSTIADSTLLIFTAFDEAGVSQDDLTVLEGIINSVNYAS